MKENRIAGGPEGIRTPDPLVANQVLSQLSYRPIKRSKFIVNGKCHTVKQETTARSGRAMLRVSMVS